MRKVLFAVILTTLVALAAPAMASSDALPPTRPTCERCGYVYTSRVNEWQHDALHLVHDRTQNEVSQSSKN